MITVKDDKKEREDSLTVKYSFEASADNSWYCHITPFEIECWGDDEKMGLQRLKDEFQIFMAKLNENFYTEIVARELLTNPSQEE